MHHSLLEDFDEKFFALKKIFSRRVFSVTTTVYSDADVFVDICKNKLGFRFIGSPRFFILMTLVGATTKVLLTSDLP